MNWNFRREMFPLLILLTMIVVGITVYPTLPDKVPTHFGLNGEPDSYSGRFGFMLLTIGLSVALYVLLTFILRIDPFWKKIQHRYDAFMMLRNLILLFFALIFFLSIHAARIGRFEPWWLGLGFGLLFIAMGNYLPRLPRNFFFGMRSPWTLASEEVWKRTHMVSGWLFVAAGIIMIILALLKVNMMWSMLFVLLPLLLFCGFVYPYYLFHKQQKSTDRTDL